MSIVATRINDEPSSTSYLGKEEETNELNSIFDKTDGTSLNQIADETHVVSRAVLENWINVETARAQPGFHKQDEAYAERAELLSSGPK